MDVVRLAGINKSYEQKKKKICVLENLNLSIPKGSFVSIMGPSGCGKSTLSKLIAGLETPDNGIVEVFGQDCSRGISKEIRKRIGYTFQNHNLAEWRTVLKNVYLPLELYEGKEDKTWKERADKYLGLVGLNDYQQVLPGELSGGMKQRCGIARAMMNEPELLVLDDPFGALDAITRKILAATISKTLRDEQKSILMITTNVDEAVQYSDTVYIMTPTPGRIAEAVDTKVSPEDRYSADFWKKDRYLDIKRHIVEVINSTHRNR